MENRNGNDKFFEENKILKSQNTQPKLTIDMFRLISVLGRGHFGKVGFKKLYKFS